MYHLRLLQALMLLLRRGVLGGAGKRRTAARFNSWSNTVPKGCCGPLCPALGLLERLFASDNVTLALQLGKTLKVTRTPCLGCQPSYAPCAQRLQQPLHHPCWSSVAQVGLALQ